MGFPALLAACAALLAPSAPISPTSGEVFVAVIHNEIIHPLTAAYLIESIDRADEEHAELLVIELDTPGGLVESTKQIVQRMNASRTPIAVYVSPSAGRAASAGFFILIAADVAAMAPGTNTGAAHPIDAAGVAGAPEKKDDIGLEKAENDIAAFVRTTALHRGRNVELSEKAVRESSSYTEGEALEHGLIDFVAGSRAELLEKLDGRKIRRFDGTEVVVHTRGPVRELEKTFVQAAIGPLLHPEIVLLLLGLGIMGLYVEISHPGMIFPGVVGVLCLLLFALAFQFLPVNTVGLLLGLLMMFPRDVPALRVSLGFVLPLAIAMAGVMGFFLVLVARSRRTPIATGMEGMVGEIGRAATAVAPEGKVYVHGETWDARSASPVDSGAEVRVLAVEGSRLVIEKKELPA